MPTDKNEAAIAQEKADNKALAEWRALQRATDMSGNPATMRASIFRRCNERAIERAEDREQAVKDGIAAGNAAQLTPHLAYISALQASGRGTEAAIFANSHSMQIAAERSLIDTANGPKDAA